MTDFLYTPLGLLLCLLLCLCVAAVFVWLAIRCRDKDWLVIVGLCALTMLGGSTWAAKKLQRRKRK